jgi:hypothetical protein
MRFCLDGRKIVIPKKQSSTKRRLSAAEVYNAAKLVLALATRKSRVFADGGALV